MIETRDSQDPIRVILVDDHQAILEGMTTWINRQPDMQMIGSVSDANLAMKLIEKEAPQVAIVDVGNEHLKLTHPEHLKMTHQGC